MIFSQFAQRLSKIENRITHEIDMHIRLPWVGLLNRFGHSRITHPDGPVVSLTTFGVRAQSVHLAIESIGRGETLPSRIVLWLDDISLINELPIGIQRLQERGLEVRLCDAYGPYKKFYPYVESLQGDAPPLVTADDDVIYPRNWLKRLVDAFEQFPDVVNCHRARVMMFDQGAIAKYESWPMADSTSPSFCHFATGVGGVIYPLPLQKALRQSGTGFLNSCPRNDDIWLHANALRAGYKVRQLGREQYRLVEIPGTQAVALHQENFTQGGNDRQIQVAYHESDLRRLRQCESELSPDLACR